MSLSLVQYVLKAAIRDKLIWSMLILIILVCSMSIFMASSAITEQDQFLAVYASGSLRILTVLGLVVFVAFFVRRSFESKDVEFLLSRPISRAKLILSYALAFITLALTVSLASGLALYIMSPSLDIPSLTLWTASIIIETIIMVNMSFFFSMVISSAATAVMAVLAFYVLARMMGQILGILESGMAGSVAQGMEVAMKMVSSVTPRLDLMGQTSWLVYGPDPDVNLTLVAIQGGVFLFLVLTAALLDLVLRQF